MQQAHTFLLGVVVLASVVIALFFFRFWRKTGDRLFLIFSGAFVLLAANWAALAFAPRDESLVVYYLLRFLAFACIIGGIIDKNRAAARSGGPTGRA